MCRRQGRSQDFWLGEGGYFRLKFVPKFSKRKTSLLVLGPLIFLRQIYTKKAQAQKGSWASFRLRGYICI